MPGRRRICTPCPLEGLLCLTPVAVRTIAEARPPATHDARYVSFRVERISCNTKGKFAPHTTLIMRARCQRQCPYNAPETGHVPGPGAYGSLHDNSSFSKTLPKTLTDEKIGFSSTGKRTSPGPSPQTAGMPGPGEYNLGMQSIAGGLKHKRRIGCKGVFG